METENPVSKKIAKQDVNAWLDHKGVLKATRESNGEIIESLVELVEEGVLSIDVGKPKESRKDGDPKEEKATFIISHKLRIPLENDGQVTLKELTYKPRLASSDHETYMKGVKTGDTDGKMRAYLCALTGQAIGIMKKIDSLDVAIGQNIVIFFITT